MMNMTDPIADMLTRIRNGLQISQKEVSIPASKMKIEIAKILKAEGFVSAVEVKGEGKDKAIIITLKYGADGSKAISGIKRISKPGLKVYAKADAVPRVLNGLGCAIISTSQGLMTDRDARKKSLGGEVVAYVW